MRLNIENLKYFLDFTLNEDLSIAGDITSEALIDDNQEASFIIHAKENMVISGLIIAEYFFKNYSKIDYNLFAVDGDKINLTNPTIIKGKGKTKEILLLERIILNYLQHLSGIASLTAKYIDKIGSAKVKICDSRKTIPGLRILQKYAVTCGGGFNHRFNLSNGILIKDNHITACGTVKNALLKAKNNSPFCHKIEIECETIEQVLEATEFGADIIMLDNMELENIKKAVRLIRESKKNILIEVSGGINLDNIAEIAQTGIDLISVGRLTHSAPAVDISLTII